MNNAYLYLAINMATMFFPLVCSFEKRVAYFRWWKFLFPSLLVTAVVFLTWDYFFTQAGVWGFSAVYTTGITIAGLPVEEILFFFTVPFASIFIYTFINRFWSDAGVFNKVQIPVTWFLFFISVTGFIIFHDKAYTASNCLFAALLLGLQLFVIKGNYMGKFYRFYLWHLIPFFIVNGILTGTGLNEAVVWYNNAENIGIRMGTIPLEDSLYSFSLMLMNISLMEWLRERNTLAVKMHVR